MIVYTAAEAKRLILAKEASGEYHVTGSLDLRGCDPTGVTLPASITDSLYLSGCDLTGVTLPTSITGSLDLRGCDLTGVTLPSSITGSLDLRGCDLTGVTLPASMGGWLDLSGCKNPDPNQWWMQAGERHRCVAISDYALIQQGDGESARFTAGCREGLTIEQALAHWGPPRTDARAKVFRATLEQVAKHDRLFEGA